MKIFPTSYMAPIIQYIFYVKEKYVLLETHENFIKQSYRNRCYIYGANGPLMLGIPLVKEHKRTLIKDKKISYDMDWRTLHWRSLEACYRSSPFFEFFEAEFSSFFEGEKRKYLLDFNEELEEKIKSLLGLEYIKKSTSRYERIDAEEDYRLLLHPKKNSLEKKVDFPEYIQVFGEKYGFLKNLSIVDLLFNEGPNAKDYLKSINTDKL